MDPKELKLMKKNIQEGSYLVDFIRVSAYLPDGHIATGKDLNVLMKAMVKNPKITKLMLDPNVLTLSDTVEFIRHLCDNPYLNYIHLYCYPVQKPSPQYFDVLSFLLKNIAQRRNIRELCINLPNISIQNLSALQEALVKGGIESFSFYLPASYNSPNILDKVMQGVALSTTLTSFNFSSENMFEDVGLMENFAFHLGTNKSLQSFSLVINPTSITDKSHPALPGYKQTLISRRLMGPILFEKLCQALEQHPALTQVTLEECGISDQVCEHVRILLEKNSTIKTLSLRSNPITAFGFFHIAEGLAKNRTLESVDLSYCQLNDQSMLTVGSLLQKTTSLRSLNLTQNNIKGDSLYFAKVLEQAHPSFRTLILANNPLQDFGAKVLAEMLMGNCSLITLDISGALIRNQGWSAITNALEKNTVLENLNMDRNPLGSPSPETRLELVLRLDLALRSNKNLKRFDCFGCFTSEESDRLQKGLLKTEGQPSSKPSSTRSLGVKSLGLKYLGEEENKSSFDNPYSCYNAICRSFERSTKRKEREFDTGEYSAKRQKNKSREKTILSMSLLALGPLASKEDLFSEKDLEFVIMPEYSTSKKKNLDKEKSKDKNTDNTKNNAKDKTNDKNKDRAKDRTKVKTKKDKSLSKKKPTIPQKKDSKDSKDLRDPKKDEATDMIIDDEARMDIENDREWSPGKPDSDLEKSQNLIKKFW